MTSKYDNLDQLLPEYLGERKMFLMNESAIGDIEDICGQLNDVSGEYEKLVEECIERLIKIIKPYKDMKIPQKIWNEEYGFWEEYYQQ
tara:strand:+ start:946 stop:1209 length:264 start_codon:yes stop_codon:yes gene_type:complete